MDTNEFFDVLQKETELEAALLHTKLTMAQSLLDRLGITELLPLVTKHWIYQHTGPGSYNDVPDWPEWTTTHTDTVTIQLWIPEEHRDKVRAVFFDNNYETEKGYCVTSDCNRAPQRVYFLEEQWTVPMDDGNRVTIKLYRPTSVGERIGDCEVREVQEAGYLTTPSSRVRMICDINA